MKMSMLDELDKHLEDVYGLKNYVSITENNRILYFSEWNKPFLECRIYSGNQVEVIELFEKVPGSLAKLKKDS